VLQKILEAINDENKNNIEQDNKRILNSTENLKGNI